MDIKHCAPIFSGKAFTSETVIGDCVVISLRPKACGSIRKPKVRPAMNQVLSIWLKHLAIVTDIQTEAGKKISLNDAEVIVSGGRGLKGPENFPMIEELADAPWWCDGRFTCSG